MGQRAVLLAVHYEAADIFLSLLPLVSATTDRYFCFASPVMQALPSFAEIQQMAGDAADEEEEGKFLPNTPLLSSVETRSFS